jgi:phospholipase A1
MISRILITAFAFICASARLLSHEAALTLMLPDRGVYPGATVAVDIVALNPGSATIPFETARSLSGKLKSESGSWPVELRAVSVAKSEITSRSFAVRRYEFVMPVVVQGSVVLEIRPSHDRSLRAVLEVESAPAIVSAAQPVATPLERLDSSTRAIDAVVNRTFAGRLSPNEPIYFIYGSGDESAAKFQFSFNYRLATFNWGEQGDEKTAHLQLGYTQRSLWDIDAHSSPFYDTSYMPEVALDTLAPASEQSNGWFTWIGMRAAFMHESNGRADASSRSLNTLYVRPAFALGPLDSWHLIVFPELFTYVTSLDENENLKDYRGYGRLRMVVGKNHGPSLVFAGWAGEGFRNLSYQLDFAYPIRTKLLDFESFLLVQYFNGYGESLMSYDKKGSSFRVGVALIR